MTADPSIASLKLTNERVDGLGARRDRPWAPAATAPSAPARSAAAARDLRRLPEPGARRQSG